MELYQANIKLHSLKHFIRLYLIVQAMIPAPDLSPQVCILFKPAISEREKRQDLLIFIKPYTTTAICVCSRIRTAT